MTCTDGVFDYACSIVGFGLLAQSFSDATHEGDGTGVGTTGAQGGWRPP